MSPRHGPVGESIGLLRSIWRHPANRNARAASLLRAVGWQCHKRVTGRAVIIDFHGLRLRCHPDSHGASGAIYFSGLPDYREMRFVLDYLRPGDHFVDVGANVGLYTLLALSAVGPSGHVHAFEPGPRAADRLQENLAINGARNVTLQRVAVSDAAGAIGFACSGDDCTAHVLPAQDGGTEVPCVRLDECLPEVDYAMAKLDIEGHEPQAVRGLAALLERGNPPVLQIEMAGLSKRYGVTTEAFIAELDALGFDCAVYCPPTRSLIDAPRPWEIPVDNVLAVSRARREQVLERIGGD